MKVTVFLSRQGKMSIPHRGIAATKNVKSKIADASFAPLLIYRALRTLRLKFYRKERKAL